MGKEVLLKQTRCPALGRHQPLSPASLPLNSLPWGQNRFRDPESPQGFHCCFCGDRKCPLRPGRGDGKGGLSPLHLEEGLFLHHREEGPADQGGSAGGGGVALRGPSQPLLGPSLLSARVPAGRGSWERLADGPPTCSWLWVNTLAAAFCFPVSQPELTFPLKGRSRPGPPAPNPLAGWPSRKSQKYLGHTVSAK